MTQKSWPWSTVAGLGDGAAELGEDDSRSMLARYFGIQDPTAEGVSKGVLNELEVTGAASPLSVDTGSAICYGLYFNDAVVNPTVTTPSLGTTGGRVVLQTNWAGTGGAALEARTRIAVKLNSDGNAAIPNLTQTAGVTWEISLATFTITTGGVITLTDDRTFRKVTAMVDSDELEDSSVTTDKINNSAVDEDKINVSAAGNGLSGGGGSALAVNVDNSTIEINADTLRVKDLGITGAKLAADSVDDTKAGNRVAQFYRRQGGNASDWSTTGTTTYTPGAVRKQAGSIGVSLAAAPAGVANITFPTAFSNVPLITGLAHALYTREVDVSFSNVTANGFTINVDIIDGTSVTTTIEVNWEATGPE